MLNRFALWAVKFAFMFVICHIIGRALSPFACMWIKREPRLDTVKRLGKKKVLLNRDKLVWWLTWFDTDDNATDEYWYGLYDEKSTKTQQYYDTHKIYRWWCRVRWLQRNSCYTFNRKFFGIQKDSKWAWQYKAIKPLLFWYNDINIGYKSHKGFDTLMLAGRVIGLRKNKEK